MSRKGKQPIKLPKGVTIKATPQTINVEGPKGKLSQDLNHPVTVEVQGTEAIVSVSDAIDNAGAMHGLYRSLINNMVVGVTEGFEKKLELEGVGYRAIVKGKQLELQLGYSHSIFMDIPEGIQITVEKNIISVKGVDKQMVGQFCADVKAKRQPVPYVKATSQSNKGRGVHYAGVQARVKQRKGAGK